MNKKWFAVSCVLGVIACSPEPVECVPGSVWTTNSSHIHFTVSNFFTGSSGYDAERASLSPEQLSALSSLCLGELDGRAAEDLYVHKATITDAHTKSRTYEWSEQNEGRQQGSGPVLDYTSFAPFLKTTQHCLRSKNDSFTLEEPFSERDTVPLVELAAPDAGAPVLSTDPNCINGIFVPYKCENSWLRFEVAVPARYTLVSERCIEKLQLSLYDDHGAPLAATDSNSTSCPKLSYDFPAGTYYLKLTKRNTAGCGDTLGNAGDSILRVQSP